ncbi:MAG: hypothetical protein RI928_2109 [Pseudomonadota bacterium]|jgi:phenol hydroxylase P4 protein
MNVAAINQEVHASHDSAAHFSQPLIYIGWDEHMMFAAPIVQLLSLETSFDELMHKVLPALYGAHPQFALIHWEQVQWFRGSTMFTPRASASLAAHGFTHKSVLRFRTPGLEGLRGSCG